MSRPVYWSAIAVEHLAGIVTHIGQSSLTYGERMADRILARVDILEVDFLRRVSEARQALARGRGARFEDIDV